MHQMAHQKRRKCIRVIKLKLQETSRPTAQRDRSPRVMGATFFWIASRSVLIIQRRWPWESSDYYAVPMAEVNLAGSQGVLLLCNKTATSLIVAYFLLQISSLNFCLLFFHCNLKKREKNWTFLALPSTNFYMFLALNFFNSVMQIYMFFFTLQVGSFNYCFYSPNIHLVESELIYFISLNF